MADWALALGAGAAFTAVSVAFTVDRMSKRIDRLQRELHAVYQYALEIDPRHDEERRLLDRLDNGDGLFDGMNHYEFVKEKRARGERTLLDPILPPESR